MAEHDTSSPAPTGERNLEQAWREAMQAHARYYEAWGQLASRWMRDLADVSRGARLPRLPPLRLNATRGVPTRSTPAGQPPPDPSSAAPGEPEVAPPVLVLEGAAGAVVSSAFLVENNLAHPVEGAVEVDHFHDAGGATVRAGLEFDPVAVSLAPGERRLVRVSLELPPSLPANVDCRSTIRVVGVPGTTIPILLRRLPG